MSNIERLILQGIKINPTNDTNAIVIEDDTGVYNLNDIITGMQTDLKIIKEDSGTQSVLDLNSLKTEIENARESNLTLDDRLDNMDANILNLQNSINSYSSIDYGTF